MNIGTGRIDFVSLSKLEYEDIAKGIGPKASLKNGRYSDLLRKKLWAALFSDIRVVFRI